MKIIRRINHDLIDDISKELHSKIIKLYLVLDNKMNTQKIRIDPCEVNLKAKTITLHIRDEITADQLPIDYMELVEAAIIAFCSGC